MFPFRSTSSVSRSLSSHVFPSSFFPRKKGEEKVGLFLEKEKEGGRCMHNGKSHQDGVHVYTEETIVIHAGKTINVKGEGQSTKITRSFYLSVSEPHHHLFCYLAPTAGNTRLVEFLVSILIMSFSLCTTVIKHKSLILSTKGSLEYREFPSRRNAISSTFMRTMDATLFHIIFPVAKWEAPALP